MNLFHKAWQGINYRESLSNIKSDAWKTEAAIAKAVVIVVSGRMFLKIGARLIPWARAQSLLKEFGYAIWDKGNNILNRAKRELFYALAEYAKKNPEKWEKLIKLGDKFMDFTKPIEKAIGRGIKKLDDIFGD